MYKIAQMQNKLYMFQNEKIHQKKMNQKFFNELRSTRRLNQPASLVLCGADHTIPRIHQHLATGSPTFHQLLRFQKGCDIKLIYQKDALKTLNKI